MATRTIKTAHGEVTFTNFDKVADRIVDNARAVARLECERWAKEVTAWMKEHAPWKDMTGNARRSLGVVRKYGQVFELILTGGVVYMVFLETREAGRTPILAPALDQWAPVLIDRLGLERV